MQPAGVRFLLQRSHGLLLHRARVARHAIGKFLRGADCQCGTLDEASEKISEFLFAGRNRFDLVLTYQLCDTHDAAAFAVGVPTEFKIVGEYPVRQGGVAEELLAVRTFAALHFGKPGADVLGLDVAERNLPAGDLEVWRAYEWNVLRFVGGCDAFGAGFQQGFQRRAVRVLGGIASGKFLLNRTEVIGKGAHSHAV